MGCAEGRMGNYCLTGTEFQLCKMKRVLWMDGGDHSTTIGKYLTPQNCTLKNGEDSKFCCSYFTIF